MKYGKVMNGRLFVGIETTGTGETDYTNNNRFRNEDGTIKSLSTVIAENELKPIIVAEGCGRNLNDYIFTETTEEIQVSAELSKQGEHRSRLNDSGHKYAIKERRIKELTNILLRNFAGEEFEGIAELKQEFIDLNKELDEMRNSITNNQKRRK